MLFDNAGTTPVVIAFQKEASPRIMKSRALREPLNPLHDIMTKPPANVLDLPLEERAKVALKAAVENVFSKVPVRDVQSMFGVTALSLRCLLKNFFALAGLRVRLVRIR